MENLRKFICIWGCEQSMLLDADLYVAKDKNTAEKYFRSRYYDDAFIEGIYEIGALNITTE